MQSSASRERLYIRIGPVKEKRVKSLLICVELAKLVVVAEEM